MSPKEQVPGEHPPTQDSLTQTCPIETTINGTVHRLEVSPVENAVHTLRERLNLTGTKLACGQGVCGACTVTLDGTPVKSCLLPATALEGGSVGTIEGLGETDLHPVQRAFMAEDALQCGYCTPGFVIEAAAFFDRWRAEHGRGTPSRDDIAAALAGHLCRCGAYAGIYTAVIKACAGDYDDDQVIPPRHDAREKVTGEAKYTVDETAEGMLHGRILRSPHGHARILRIDISKAEAMEGVAATLVLNPERVIRYAGQEILAVAATDTHTADAALRAVEVEYEVLPAVVDAESARQPEAPLVYSEGHARRTAPYANEGPKFPGRWRGNLRGPFRLLSKQPGRARKAIEKARTAEDWHLVEGRWSTQTQCHTCLEPHACLARWDGPDRLTVHVSTQAVNQLRWDISLTWGLPLESVRVLAAYVGGGFGCKGELTAETIVAIELARCAGAPVRVVLDRREEIGVAGSRPAEELELGLATDPEGQLQGMKLRGYADAGVAVGALTGHVLRLIYPQAPRDLAEWDVVTHSAPGKPFRGPGGPPALWAIEQAVDETAILRGEDPVCLRRRWDTSPGRLRLYDWVKDLPAWKDRNAVSHDKGRFRRGVGLAAAVWIYFYEPATQVKVTAGPRGFTVSTATQDIGNGSRTVLAITVAEILGIEPSQIEVLVGDSDLVSGPVSTGSRTTASVVPAAQDATHRLRAALARAAAVTLGLEGAKAAPGGVTHAAGRITWAEVLAAVAPHSEATRSETGRRPGDRGGAFFPVATPPSFLPEESKRYRPKGFAAALKRARGMAARAKDGRLVTGRHAPSAVQVIEVEVDTRLGKTRVLGAWSGLACGRIVSPELAHSQVEGAIIQGISYALYEERRLDPHSGALLTGSMDDYRIAGIGDIPPIESHFENLGFDHVAGGAVGIAELAALPTAAAVGNAVRHATGWRPRKLPLRPDRVVAGLRR